jgi:PTS system nitrogen regulatory IIA component
MRLPTMNNIASYIAMKDVVLDLDVLNKEQLFYSVDQHMHRQHGVPQGNVALHLKNRERIGSTGLGHGVAIPHARVKNLPDVQCGYFRLKSPIVYETPDQQPVTDVFVLLVPDQADQEHLEILATLCRYVESNNFRRRLHDCASVDDIHRLFSGLAH